MPPLPGESRDQYRQRIMDIVCGLLAQGHTLRKICDERDDMPDNSTVCFWCRENTELAKQYADAREAQADFFVDEMITIADTEEDPQRAKVRIDARKWHASKTAPKKYGDKLDISGQVDVVNTVSALFQQITPQPSLLGCVPPEDAILIE